MRFKRIIIFKKYKKRIVILEIDNFIDVTYVKYNVCLDFKICTVD